MARRVQPGALCFSSPCSDQCWWSLCSLHPCISPTRVRLTPTAWASPWRSGLQRTNPPWVQASAPQFVPSPSCDPGPVGELPRASVPSSSPREPGGSSRVVRPRGSALDRRHLAVQGGAKITPVWPNTCPAVRMTEPACRTRWTLRTAVPSAHRREVQDYIPAQLYRTMAGSAWLSLLGQHRQQTQALSPHQARAQFLGKSAAGGGKPGALC